MSFIVGLLSFEPESTLKLGHVPLQPYQEILKLYPKVLLLPLLCEYSSSVLFVFDDVSPLHNSICKLGVVQWTAVQQVCEMDCFSVFLRTLNNCGLGLHLLLVPSWSSFQRSRFIVYYDSCFWYSQGLFNCVGHVYKAIVETSEMFFLRDLIHVFLDERSFYSLSLVSRCWFRYETSARSCPRLSPLWNPWHRRNFVPVQFQTSLVDSPVAACPVQFGIHFCPCCNLFCPCFLDHCVQLQANIVWSCSLVDYRGSSLIPFKSLECCT